MSQSQKKIKVLQTPYFEQQYSQSQIRARRRQLKRVHQKRLLGISLIFLAIFSILTVRIVKTQRSTADVVRQSNVAQKKLKQVTTQRKNLKQQVKQLNNDDYLQKLVREKYYYSKSGETIYNLPAGSQNNLAK
ncbi:FtsB family cell division protein [Liquorilactobacillus sicerae]|uniref:FtsB family cell division protein n=1 Tax=Liquorilactobacillus sicerae TaxID=1416943 RepID=UPI00248058F0|nr:septum formation initiator family protein [Liquorilactobacillus sicerae]